MNALDRLRALLDAAVVHPLARAWPVEKEIDDHIERLARHLKDGGSEYVPKHLQEEAVKRFWTSRRIENLRDGRLVSHGIALPVGPQRVRVIEDVDRFPVLLDGIDQFLPAPKQYRRCYQGLLAGYFGYDPTAKNVPAAGKANWETLRGYLGKRATKVVDIKSNPAWVDSLQQHQTLLSTDPCGRYGPAMLDGDRREVDELRNVLRVSDSSWFMQRLYLAQIEAATKRTDPEFLTLLDRVVQLIRDNELVQNQGLALVLNKHAAMKAPPLRASLRDIAVELWRNPWLKSNSSPWGNVSAEAKALVTEWLKLEFIEAFFSLLADERSGDTRRLDFWKRYVHAIESVHFALGTDARSSTASDFVALRKKMEGLSVPLQDPVRSNNAFIMQMGAVAIVEFGEDRNACYGYDAKQPLPFDFSRPVVTPVDADNSLKHSQHVLKWRHQDGVHGWAKWEAMFEASLAESFNIHPKKAEPSRIPRAPQAGPPAVPPLPATQPSPLPASTRVEPNRSAPAGPVSSSQPLTADENWEVASWKTTNYTRKALSQFAERFSLSLEDMTGAGGNLWVRTKDSNLAVNGVLLRWGFTYKAGKGWHKKLR